MTDQKTATLDQKATSEEPIVVAAPAQNGKRGIKRFITPALALVAALAIGLFGGIFIGNNNSSSATEATGIAQRGTLPDGTTGGGPDGAGGGFTSGTITAIDGDTITLELADGSTVTVTAGSDTTVTKTEDSSVSDLATGETITVIGETDDDGNVTATSVSEGATMGGFGGGTPPADSGE